MKNEDTKTNSENPLIRWVLTSLRILIGWHFLYEGASKLFASEWTSAGYLLESHWLFSDVFHWITTNPSVLRIVDLLNIWGLIIIGLALFLGIFTRFASAAGALLLLLYYMANPPLVGFMGENTGEGHYLIVNKNLIELITLIFFAILPNSMFYGLDRILSRFSHKRKKPEAYPETADSMERRELLKDLVSLPVLGVFTYGLFRKRQWESFEERHLISRPSRVNAVTGASPVGGNLMKLNDLKEKVPTGRIKDLEISRLICGGNLISGYAHSRDLVYVSPLVEKYFSDEKVLQTLQLCEHCGVNTAVLRVDKNTLRIIEKHRKRDGKLQWIAQAKITKEDIRSDIDAAVDNGADAVFVHGGVCDRLVAEDKIELINEAVEYIKKRGAIAGIGAHDLRVPIACEHLGLDPDFYMKTINSGNYWTAGPRLVNDSEWKPDPLKIVEPEYAAASHDNIWSISPVQTIEYMKRVQKPWIGYKVLGAGAILPEDGFKYAFANGTDFICVGMFDFQIIEDANIVTGILKSDLARKRPWMA